LIQGTGIALMSGKVFSLASQLTIGFEETAKLYQSFICATTTVGAIASGLFSILSYTNH